MCFFVEGISVDMLIEGILVDTVTGDEVEKKKEKMSKSRYNGVDPRSVLDQYGCDISR
uniref:Uncharacterized protein n=1 Tax=Romanomermis culicivorax TaxID=13658 RepID=A0A915KT08_ROMCU